MDNELRPYAAAWSSMMVRIWRDRIGQLRAMRTGRLLGSVSEAGLTAAGLEADIRFRFVRYGIYVDSGRRGEEDGRGRAERKPWFTPSWRISRRVLMAEMQRRLADDFRGMVAETLAG